MLAPIRIDDNLLADFSSPLFTCIQRGGWYELQCARPKRASCFLLCTITPSRPKGVARLSFTARIGRAQFYRARSASKKDGLATPAHPF